MPLQFLKLEQMYSVPGIQTTGFMGLNKTVYFLGRPVEDHSDVVIPCRPWIFYKASCILLINPCQFLPQPV